MSRSVEELVRTVVALPNLCVGGALELNFAGDYFPGFFFGLRIIEVCT